MIDELNEQTEALVSEIERLRMFMLSKDGAK